VVKVTRPLNTTNPLKVVKRDGVDLNINDLKVVEKNGTNLMTKFGNVARIFEQLEIPEMREKLYNASRLFLKRNAKNGMPNMKESLGSSRRCSTNVNV